ncbi:transglutaminase family protein, partial [Candidatus Poribacteria bacterium]|nr:transglutaminase family protein [Candidatus Poribacteria bacterium]
MRLARVRLGSVSLICLLQVVLCMAVSAEHAYAFSNAVVKKDSETIDDLASRGFDYGSLDIPEDVRQKLSESALTVRRLPRVLRTEGSEKRSKSIRYSSQKAYVEALLRLTEQVEKLTAVDTVADVRENVKALIQTRNELSSLNKEIQAVFAETGKKCVSKRFDGKILERHRELVAAYAETHREIMQSLDVIERICRGGIPTIRELEVIIGESEKLHEFLKSRKLKEPPPLINAESLPYTSERRNPKNLPMSAAGKHFESITPKDVVLPFSPPEPADLQLTIDVQITPEIAALAASLDHSPYKIFKYVRDNFEFDAYMGSRKGSSETLREHSGNAYDLCSLLIALLRASNVPTRYVTGVVMMPVEQARNWLGFNDTVEAANLIATALDSGAVLWWEGDNPVSISFRHAWVIAYLPYADYRGVENDDTGKMWIPLDPSVKEFVYQEGIDIPTEMGFDAESFVFNEYVSTFHELSPVELYVDRIQQHLAVAHPGLLYPDILRLGTIVPFGLETLPGSTPYLVRTLDDAFAGIPAYLRYRIRFRIHDDSSVFVDHTANLPDIAGKRVTISYVAATEADQDVIDSYGGLYETPPHLVRLRPVLKIGGADVAMGPDSGIMMGITHESDMYFYPPFGAGNQIPEVHNPVISGTYQGIGIETGRIPADVFVPSDEGELPDVDGFTGGKLYQTAMEYLQKIEWPEDTVAQTMRMVVTKDVSEAIVENTILVTFVGGTPWTFEWKALTVDADRCIVGPFSVDGDDTKAYDYMVLTGADGSIQENRVFEDMYDQEAISAVKILELANDMGIPVCRISGNIDAECPGNNWPAQVRSAVAAAIARGHVVTIPRAGITHHEWSGIGYIDMDPASGAAGYIISGGHAGGSTVDIWDSWKMTWFTIFRKITSITAVINHPAQNEYFPQVSWWDFFGWALYFDVDYTIRYDDGS